MWKKNGRFYYYIAILETIEQYANCDKLLIELFVLDRDT